MKYLIYYIVLFLSLFNGANYARASNLPEDFTGAYTRKIEQQKEEDELSRIDFNESIASVLEIGEYVYGKYSYDEIADADFVNVLKQFFPDADEDKLEERRQFLEYAYNAYNKMKELYGNYIATKLMPKAQKVVQSESDYDLPNEVPYKEAPADSFYVVHNFKKILSYSSDPEERKAVEKFREKEHQQSISEKINRSLEKIDWKKVWFYGQQYENPLLSKLGITQWQTTPEFQLRMMSPHTYIDDNKTLDFGIHIVTEPFSFVLANNLDASHLKPQIDLSQSENVKNIQITLPIPLNSVRHPEAHKYFGDFIIPLKVEVEDVNKPVTLKGQIKLVGCDNQLACDNYVLKLEQTLMPRGDEIEPNGYGNYFNKHIAALPKTEQKHLHLKKIFMDEYDGGQAVFLQFTTDKTIKNFKVFLEEVAGFTLFSAPMLRLYDNRIDAVFIPLNKDADLRNAEFIITAGLNDLYNLRLTEKASAASMLEPDKNTLNVALILLAIFGGFILNFMPCVFPVLSLKIVSVSRAEEKNRRQLKKSLAYTCWGIYCGFAVLIGVLCLAKFLGYSLGWGMQFQNINFLVIMTFVLSGFIIIIRSVSFDIVSRFSNNGIGKAASFAVGALIVLLSTPCTAPYLATAIGFALSGTYIELVIIMSAVAFGLSLPYLITLIANAPEKIFPKPGKWMQKLHIAAQIMLLLTIMWLLNLIWLQTDAKFVLKMGGCVLIFTWIFNIYHKFGLYLQGVLDERITEKMLLKIKIASHAFMLAIFAAMLLWCSSAAQKSRIFNYARNTVNRHTELNQDIIRKKVAEGRSVLLEVGADWCLTCHVNDALVLTESNLKNWQKNYNLDIIRIDWTNYSQTILNYMEKFGRKGIPFYVLYTPYMREGMVLPEILAPDDMQNLLNNAAHK